jgi:hypothetical protein
MSVRTARLKKGYILSYMLEANRDGFYEHRLTLIKFNKVVARAKINKPEKFLKELYLGGSHNSYYGGIISGSLRFEFDRNTKNVRLVSEGYPSLYKQFDNSGAFDQFKGSSAFIAPGKMRKKNKGGGSGRKHYTTIYRHEIEKFIYWLKSSINSASFPNGSKIINDFEIKSMMQNNLLLIEKEGVHSAYANK